MDYIIFIFIAIVGLEFLLNLIFEKLSGFLLVVVGIIAYIVICFILALFAPRRNDDFLTRFLTMLFKLPICLIVVIIIAVIIS